MSFQEDIVPQKAGTYAQRHEAAPTPTNYRRTVQTMTSVIKKSLVYIIIPLLIFMMLKSAFFLTDSGYIYLHENTLTGQIHVYDEPGFHGKIPFFSRVTRYAQVWTVDFGTKFAGTQIRQKPAITLRFADTYTAKIPATFRYKLPRNRDKIKMIHREFRDFYNLIDSQLIPISRDVIVNTATQYSGEEFFQGGLNQFKRELEDQLRNGLYQTELKKVKVEQMDLPQTQTSYVWKTVPILSPDSKRIHQRNPLDDYGIEVIQVTLGVPVPEHALENLLAEKKRLEVDEIEKLREFLLVLEDQKIQLAKKDKESALLQKQLDIVQEELKIQQAKKEGELAIAVAIAKARKDEELAIALATTKAQKEEEFIVTQEEQKIQMAIKERELALEKENEKIQLAKKAEELAIAQKQLEIVQAELKIKKAQKEEELAIALATTKAQKEEELIIAQANMEIQKANLEAAQFEAKAILEKGIAETDILKAKYEARLPEIYIAEIQKEIAAIIYPNLKGIPITMPHNIINLGDKDNKLQTNLDVLSSFATLGVMESLEKKALETDTTKP
ncbi:MAG: SPFH domain-containing protein [Pseudomonadota bacterium]